MKLTLFFADYYKDRLSSINNKRIKFSIYNYNQNLKHKKMSLETYHQIYQHPNQPT